MKNAVVWTLITVNAILLLSFGYKMTKSNTAMAQVNRHGDYLMVPGEVIGGNNAVVYVVDQNTHQLSAMSFDDPSKTLSPMSPRDMERDFDAGTAGNMRKR